MLTFLTRWGLERIYSFPIEISLTPKEDTPVIYPYYVKKFEGHRNFRFVADSYSIDILVSSHKITNSYIHESKLKRDGRVILLHLGLDGILNNDVLSSFKAIYEKHKKKYNRWFQDQ